MALLVSNSDIFSFNFVHCSFHKSSFYAHNIINSLNKHIQINNTRGFGDASANANDFNILPSEKCQVIVALLFTYMMIIMTEHYWSPDRDSAGELCRN